MESAANNHILAERDTEERFACTKLAQRRSNLFDHLDDGRKPIDRDDATRGGGDSMEDGRAATPRYASNPPRARALKALKLCRYDSLWSVSAVLKSTAADGKSMEQSKLRHRQRGNRWSRVRRLT